jgi:hypothetical protein
MHPSPDVLALLALGEKAGTADERIHVDSCPVCLAEVAEFVRVAAVGRSATATDQLQAPPPEVWRAVRSELGLTGDAAALGSSAPASDVSEGQGVSDGPDVSDSPSASEIPGASDGPAAFEGQGASDGRMQEVPQDNVRQLAGEWAPQDSAASAVSSAPVPDSGRRRSSRARRGLSLALAAAIALVVGFGLGFFLNRFVQPTQTVIERAQLQALPAWPGARGEAWVERDGTGDRFLEVRVDSSRPDPGYRQVWLIDRNVKAMASMGFLNNGVGRFNIPDDLDLNQFPIVDVSAEPANDEDPAHSGDSIVRGQLAS